MKIVFHTLGCKVNQYETQAMRRLLEAEGFETGEFVPGDEAALSADGLVINSCTVTGESDRKLRQLLRRCRRDNPHAVLALTGCMPQAFPEEAEGFAEADIVLGNASRRALPRHLAAFFQSGRRIVDIGEHDARLEPLEIDDFQGRTRAFVKIQDGCNRFCSYCIIPYARGFNRSKSLEDLKLELYDLSAKGYKEVVLVGIDLSSFGKDIGCHLVDAVTMACTTEGIERVRLGSLEPLMLTDQNLSILAGLPNFCPQFHLSLQSGCDATLKRMNRHYDTAFYRDLVQRIRSRFDNPSITTDLMVGFPGETQEEFEQSLDFAREIGFAKVHVFAYSIRPGTRAAKMPDQLTRQQKEQRSHQMAQVTEESRKSFLQSQVGMVESVLFETENLDGMQQGYTKNYTPVCVQSDRELCGSIHSVCITGAKDDYCIGQLLTEQEQAE